jgi:lipid A 3-O-deacylase
MQGMIGKTRTALVASLLVVSFCSSATAQEVFAGVYAHEVDTPFTLDTGEGGMDFAVGYRFPPFQKLHAIGRPAPYVITSFNTQGDTSFVGGGIGWRLGDGRWYFRPALGLVVHDGPARRLDPITGKRTDLGSRVLFQAEIGAGFQASERLAVEASWMHISHATLFNSNQNPGIDMVGLRLNWRVR